MTIPQTTPKKIIAKICRDFDIEKEYLLGRNRSAYTIKCRREIASQLRILGLSFPEIGRLLNRDHSSILDLLKDEKIKI